MEKLTDIYRELHDKGVLMFSRALSFSSGSRAACIEMNGSYGLFVDITQLSSLADETVVVAHEAGHISTGSTHALSSPYDLIQRHEYRADKWAIKKLIPKDELEEAMSQGYTEPWDLAERFEVTEEFIKKAVAYYYPER